MSNSVTLRFYALTGAPRTINVVECESIERAHALVVSYVAPHGFHHVQQVVDCEDGTVRFTCTTPGGRHGRNVASAECGEDHLEPAGSK